MLPLGLESAAWLTLIFDRIIRAHTHVLSSGVDVDISFLFFFFSFPFSISIWTSFVFILSFSCGYYAVSSLSVSAATRLAYYTWYIPGMYVSWYVTYADLTFSFLSEVYALLQLLCVPVSSFVLICFPPEVIFRSSQQSYWSLSCDNGLHSSHELMWEHQQQQEQQHTWL